MNEQSLFKDQVILITGAASGFGKLLAQTLSERGAKLVLSDINEEGLSELSETLPGEVSMLVANVALEKDSKALVEQAIADFGHLDIAINNAGISAPMKSLIEVTEKELDANYAVNTKGVFFGMKYQIKHMLQHGSGSILNVASIAGICGAPKLSAYVASKHAVVGITKTAAVEYAAQGIRVNAACPFFSPTPMVSEGIDDKLMDFVALNSPSRRLGKPEEMVSAMLHIIAPDNTYMTGQAIAIDGGVTAI